MRVIVTQMRIDSPVYAAFPLFKHNGYAVDDHGGQMFTSEVGYEISAVYIVPDLP
jgi:hypothetical protein